MMGRVVEQGGRAVLRAASWAIVVVLGAACGGEPAGPGVAEATAGTAEAAAFAPSAPSPASAVQVASAPPSAPSAVPRSERPSAKIQRPVGGRSAAWQRMFDTYGELLDVEYILDDYHRLHPDRTRVVTLGETHGGRPVKALLIADRPSEAGGRPAVLLNAAHHGDEPLSAAIVLDAIDTLLADPPASPAIARYLSELSIWCVPMVNPDGFAAFMTDFGAGRKNGRETRKGGRGPLRARGVDLNRNYPFRWGAHGEAGSSKSPDRHNHRGPSPASEPEAQAMIALSDREHFVASISYHVGTVALLAPYTIDGVPLPRPNEAWIVAQDVARRMPKVNDHPVIVRKNLYTVDGTDQDYHRFAHGTLALLLESAARSWESADMKQRGILAIRPSWGALFDRYLDGPSVEGHVRDDTGRPVSAEVRVVEVETRAGERWTSRCSDGFFGRYLPKAGSFTVRVLPPGGGSPIDTAVEVAPGKGRAKVDIVVPGVVGGGCTGPAAAP